MAQIEGLQVNIVAKIDQLQKSLDEVKKGLASVATESEKQADKISNPLKGAADAIEARYGNLAGSIAGRLASLANPAAFAATAVATLGAALLAYAQSFEEKTPTIEEALKNHASLIKNIKSSYEEALTGLNDYTAQSEDALRSRLGNSISVLKAQVQTLGVAFTSQFRDVIPGSIDELTGQLQAAGANVLALPAKFEPFRAAIEALRQSVADGNPNFIAFKDAVDRIGAANAFANPEINRTANELSNAVQQAYQAQRALEPAAEAFYRLGNASTTAATNISAFNSAMQAMQSLSPNQMTALEKLRSRLQEAIIAAGPDERLIQKAFSDFQKYQKEIMDADAQAAADQAAKEAERNAAKLAREQESITKRLEMLVTGWGTEEEQLAAHLVRNQDLINQAKAKEVIDDQTHKILMLGAEEEYQKKIQALRVAGMNSALTATGEVFSAMGRVVQAGGKKNVRLAKMFGVAEAIIATMVAANKAMAVSASAGPAAAFAAWAAVAAKGLATVAAIRSVNESGGGGGGTAGAAGGGGGSTGAGGMAAGGGGQPGGNSVYINLQGQTFGRDQVRDLIKQIADFQKDGGQVVFA